MKLLALDTATEACSAALYWDGEVSERFAVAPREHARLILPMVEALLAEAGARLADLDAFAFGRGPGGFTGVRIAAGVVQGLAFGVERPVVPVSTLQALAQGVHREHGHQRVLAALDARMEEVYWGAWRVDAEGLMEAVTGERVCAPDAVPIPAGAGWHGAGSGFERHGARLSARLGVALAGWQPGLPRAGDLAVLGAAGWRRGLAVAAQDACPVYLRDQVAVKVSRSG